MPLDVERFNARRGSGVALALNAGERCFDGTLYTNIFVDAYFHAAKTAFDVDDGTVHQVRVPQVEGCEAEAVLYLGTLEPLSAKLVEVFPETDVYLVHLTAVKIYLL